MRRILKPIFPKVLCKALGMILIVGLGAVQAQEVSIAQGGTYTGCDFFFVAKRRPRMGASWVITPAI